MRAINVLHPPVIARASADHVPAQVVHRNDLRWQLRAAVNWPHNLPCVSGSLHSQITRIVEWSHAGRIMELGTHCRFLISSVQHSNIKTLERRNGEQAAVTAGELANERVLVHVIAVGKAVVSCVELVTLDLR